MGTIFFPPPVAPFSETDPDFDAWIADKTAARVNLELGTAALLDEDDLFDPTSPGNIGGTTPAAGVFTDFSSSGAGIRVSPTDVIPSNPADPNLLSANFSVLDTAKRNQFLVSNSGDGEYANFITLVVHGSAYSGSNYAGEVSDAGRAMILAQGAQVLGLNIGTYSDVPVAFFTGNVKRLVITSTEATFNVPIVGGGVPAVDTGWTANADAGDKTAVIPNSTDLDTLVTLLNQAAADSGTAFKIVAEKVKAIETSLVGLLLPNA